MAFYIIAVFFVIAPDQQYLRVSRLAVLFRFVMTSPPASCRALSRQVFQLKLENIFDNRPFKAYRVILFSLWTVAGHMLGGVIQPANKGDTRVDHHNFAMHPAKHIGAHTKKARAGIVVAEHYASCRQFIDKLIAEIRRTVAIQQDFRFNPALRCCQ
ncbi:Uncharacterised protein [Shigella sonnei]|nr:Uncharacterised protein [Shigella sonnei]CSP54659.1 Uncharacterised protein [Shigella sonnei]CSP64518.1 Uncharacterised protein [Shigella sonnei]CSR78765.1 Uncharacterised protein [Shigella sonnei]